tara:strand:+ start:1778 stop:2209 length:432 start_codon:yes stop_codon:yes gene_type:complete
MTLDPLVGELFKYYDGPVFLPHNYARLDQLIKYSVRCLGRKKEKAKRILIDASPRDSVPYLVLALKDPHCRDAAIDVFLEYGASDITVSELVPRLVDQRFRDSARRILIGYGEDALSFLRLPKGDMSLRREIRGIMEAIQNNY